ncbi:hypothetical protein CBR_g51975 [Chara braunii]|uniref:Uncharacterized protein n=1 Tax=Chara braunii TaxID=69332 RepID=A0A388K6J8_CHABU|nr:hypothetical protein CBR_g51975 [Chara braunii]|eukprot:GBG65675.1 hypothetical protein CBR_g51975 [Chara braunii]
MPRRATANRKKRITTGNIIAGVSNFHVSSDVTRVRSFRCSQVCSRNSDETGRDCDQQLCPRVCSDVQLGQFPRQHRGFAFDGMNLVEIVISSYEHVSAAMSSWDNCHVSSGVFAFYAMNLVEIVI